jgi:hypothetical protein
MGNSEERKGSFSNCNPGTAMGWTHQAVFRPSQGTGQHHVSADLHTSLHSVNMDKDYTWPLSRIHQMTPAAPSSGTWK